MSTTTGTEQLIVALQRQGLIAETVNTGGGCMAVEARRSGEIGDESLHALITDGNLAEPFGIDYHDNERYPVVVALFGDHEDQDPTVIIDAEDAVVSDIDSLAARVAAAL